MNSVPSVFVFKMAADTVHMSVATGCFSLFGHHCHDANTGPLKIMWPFMLETILVTVAIINGKSKIAFISIHH